MKAFEYIPVATITEAIEVLSREGAKARLLAGGTDLVTRIRMGKEDAPDCMVSLRRVGELDYITAGEDGSLRLGALATLRHVEEDERVREKFAALAEAAGAVGSVQIRNVGTVVGNVCSASSAADTAIALLSLGARVKVIGPAGANEVDLTDFFTGARQNCLGSGEMVKEVCIPAPKERAGGTFLRVSPRRAMDCSVAAVAATVALGEEGQIDEVRIGLGAVAPTPIRAEAAEAVLKGETPGGEVLKAAGEAATQECQPIEDIRGGEEYRKQMVGVLVERAVAEACRRASR